jgi:hypothetical protein
MKQSRVLYQTGYDYVVAAFLLRVTRLRRCT